MSDILWLRVIQLAVLAIAGVVLAWCLFVLGYCTFALLRG